MADARGSTVLEPMLAELRGELELPATPPTVPAVMAQLRADRLQGARPPFPGIAVWSRPRRIAVALAALVALVAVAAAGRVVVGSIEIRNPGVRPTTSPPEIDLGRQLTPAEASTRVAFPVRLPASLGPPEAAYALASDYGARASIVAFVWRPSPTLPLIEGTPWGAILMELSGDTSAVKDVYATPGYEHVDVNGMPGVWIDTPHTLTLFTPGGREAQFEVRGNVLVWVTAGTTFRLETALDERAALMLAREVP